MDYIIANWPTLAGALATLLIFGGLASYSMRYLKRPQNYVMRWLTEEQKAALTQAGIPFTKRQLVGGDDGVTISKEHIKRARRLLNARVVDTFSVQGMELHEAILSPETRDPELEQLSVTVAGHVKWWHFRRRYNRYKLGKLVRQVFLPSVRKNIVVHVGNGESISPTRDANFHLYLFASPQGTNNAKLPANIAGAPVLGNKGLQPSGVGVPIIDDRTGFSVAELSDNCLYVLMPVCYEKDEVSKALLVRVLQRVQEELSADSFLAEIAEAIKSQAGVAATDAQDCTVSAVGLTGRLEQVLTSLTREILAPVVGGNVHIHLGSGTELSPRNHGPFTVFINACPMDTPKVQGPERLFGHRLLKRGSVFLPSAFGLPLTDENGLVYGELVGRNLYLYQQFAYYGAKMEAAMLGRLLFEVRKEILRGPADSPRAIAERVSAQFVAECKRQVSFAAGKKVTAQDVNQTQHELRQQLKAGQQEERNLFRLQAAPIEELGREYDELLNIQNVTDVTVNDQTIVVKTKTLYCIHPKTRQKHEIGAFEIHITPGSNSIKWYNTTRRVNAARNGMNAPHVDENGNACMGSTKDLFPALIGKREFTSVVQLAIAFVEAVNLDDNWGAHIIRWPVVE